MEHERRQHREDPCDPNRNVAVTRASRKASAAVGGGHTPGQTGVLVEEADRTIFLAGDSSYTQEPMLRGVPDGVGADDEAERRTHELIRTYAPEHPTVYLVAHDPESAVRLAERRVVQPVAAEVAA